LKRAILATAAATGLLILGGGIAHADDPAPPPAPAPPGPVPVMAPSQDAADQFQKAWQQYNDMPCGVSFGPVPSWGFNWIRVKPC
jgi:hypothetical protein